MTKHKAYTRGCSESWSPGASLLLKSATFMACISMSMARCIVLICLFALPDIKSIAADENTSMQPPQILDSLQSKMSFDTDLVRIQEGSIVYDIPRNYFEVVDAAEPVFKITYSGFRPFSKQTVGCFARKFSNGPSDCPVIRFVLLGSEGPGPGGRAFSTDEMFENFRKNFPNLTPRRDVFGYDVYEQGPFPTRSEIYRKQAEHLYFNCFISEQYDRARGSVCTDLFSLDDGNGINLFFYPYQVGKVSEIEKGIRSLMAGFRK